MENHQLGLGRASLIPFHSTRMSKVKENIMNIMNIRRNMLLIQFGIPNKDPKKMDLV